MKINVNVQSLGDSSYRPDIDGLRAIAVISVVVFHAYAHTKFGGFVGVDIFFVISGYLISGIILRNISTSNFSYTGFYIRRIRRIFPALITMIASVMIIGWLIMFNDEYAQLCRHIVAAAAFVSNFQLYSESGYFETASANKPLLHLWSLGIEEQFYIIWPPVVIALHRLGRGWRPIGYGLATLLAASLACSLWLMQKDMSAAFYIPLARFWELLVGAGIALAEVSGVLRSLPTALRQFGAWVGSALLIASLAMLNSDTPFPGAYALPPVLGSALLICAGMNGAPNRTLLSHPILRWIGGVSYPLYLWHWPVLVFAHLMAFNGPISATICVVLAVLLAWWTKVLVEQPLRYGGTAVQRAYQLAAGMGAMGAMGLIAIYAGIPTASSSSKESTEIYRMERQIDWKIPAATPSQIADCHRMFPERSALTPRERDDNFCMLEHSGQPDVAMIGDSLNLSLFPGLTKQPGHNVVMISASEAAPFSDTRTTEHNDRIRLFNYRLTNQAIDYAIAAPNIKVVILSFLNGDWFLDPKTRLYIQDMQAPNTAPEQPDADAHTIFVRTMRRTLDRLSAAGKPVVFILPNQRMAVDMLDCLSGKRLFHAPSWGNRVCGEPRKSLAESRRLAYDGWVRTVAASYPLVQIFDVASAFCDSHFCYAAQNGHLLYRDRVHLSMDGSAVVAPKLLRIIDQAEALQLPPPITMPRPD